MFGGNEHRPRRDFLLVHPERMREIVAWFMRHAPPDASLPDKMARLFSFFIHGRESMRETAASHCEVAALFVAQLGLPDHVQAAVRYTWEQWNGKGMAFGLAGVQTPVAARILHLAQAVVVAHSIGGNQAAEAIARERSGSDFDPELVEAFLIVASRPAFWEVLDRDSVHATVVSMHVPPSFDVVPDEMLDNTCEAIADFIDIRFQQTWNHSRETAVVAAATAQAMGLPDDEVTRIRRAALVHDLGLAAVPSTAAVLELNPSAEAAGEVRRHPLHTAEVLRRVEAFAELVPYAVAHHERYDGLGYPSGLHGEVIPLGARILAVSDHYAWLARASHGVGLQGLLEQMRPLVGRALCPDAFGALEQAVDSGVTTRAPRRRKRGDPGLTERELEVLRSLAAGLTNRQIAGQLTISEKTVEHHLDHMYGKLGVSSRTSAVVHAVQRGLV